MAGTTSNGNLCCSDQGADSPGINGSSSSSSSSNMINTSTNSKKAQEEEAATACSSNKPNHGGKQSRKYFEPPFLSGIRIPVDGLFDDWEVLAPRVFEFLREARTTTMVTLWATAPVLTSVVFFALFILFSSLRTFLVLYFVFCLFDPAPYNGVGRRYAWVEKLPIWQHINAYFQPKMVFEEPLDPSCRYVMGSHPHGVIGYMSQLIAGTTGLGITSHFPGLVVRGVTMPFSFAMPFYRDYALAMGCLSCDRNSIRRALSDHSNNQHQSLLIVVGGADESMLSHEKSADLVLLKRKGFVREAIRAGCDLVPIYNFNENSIYRLVPNEPGTFAHRFEMAIKKVCGFTILLFHGQNLFFTPYRTQLTSVVGRPIRVRQNIDPTKEEINHYHSLYVAELTRIYRKYKPRFDPDANNIRFVA